MIKKSTGEIQNLKIRRCLTEYGSWSLLLLCLPRARSTRTGVAGKVVFVDGGNVGGRMRMRRGLRRIHVAGEGAAVGVCGVTAHRVNRAAA